MIDTKLLMALAFAAAVLLITWLLIRRHKAATSSLNFDDLLLGDDGKFSKAAAVMLGAFACTTWVIVYLTVMGKLTEGYFAAYVAAWVIPSVTKLIKSNPPPSGA